MTNVCITYSIIYLAHKTCHTSVTNDLNEIHKGMKQHQMSTGVD